MTQHHAQTSATVIPVAPITSRPAPLLDTTTFLAYSAVAVARLTALGALDGCTFGADGLNSWGNPTTFTDRLMALYDGPHSARLELVRHAWQATTPEVGADTFSFTDTDGATTDFTRHGTVTFRPGATAEVRSADDTVTDEVLGNLLSLARQWLDAHPFTDGLPAHGTDSVARSAEFAFLFLNAVAQAHVGQEPAWPQGSGEGSCECAAQASRARRRVAVGLHGQPAFTALGDRDRQGLGELLLLMPTFLAAMYSYARLADDPCSQEMVAELANDSRTRFFGIPAHRTDFQSLGDLDFGWL